MLDKRSKEKLEAYTASKKRNVARHIYILHRYFNEWADKKWKEDGWDDIRPEHLRLISIIGTEEVNNNELAKRARVTKQAMSKMVTVLEKHGVLNVQPDPVDSRAKIISISKEGVDFLQYFNGCGGTLNDKFRAMIGNEKTETLLNILTELTEQILAEEMKDWVRK